MVVALLMEVMVVPEVAAELLELCILTLLILQVVQAHLDRAMLVEHHMAAATLLLDQVAEAVPEVLVVPGMLTVVVVMADLALLAILPAL
jgi:hypothetical protein